MKHRKQNWSIFALVVLIAGGLTWWFTHHKTYKTVVPAEARMVMKIDFNHLAQKEKQVSLLNHGWEWLHSMRNGIDLTQPAYVFVTPNEYIGLVAAVDDEEAFEEGLKHLPEEWRCTRSDEDEDATWATLGSGWQLAWREGTMLLMGPGSIQETNTIRQTMRTLLNEDYDESFSATKREKWLETLKGDANLVADIGALPTPYNTFLKLQLPENVPAAKVYVCSAIQLTDKGIRLDNRLQSNDENVQKQLTVGNMPAMQGVFEQEAGTSDLITLALATRGDRLLKTLREDNDMRALLAGLNQVIDADMMVNAIKGDVLFRINRWPDGRQPDFKLTACLSNQQFLKHMTTWQQQAAGRRDISLTQLGNGTFEVGYKNKHFYFSAAQHMLRCGTSPDTSATQAPRHVAAAPLKGNVAYMRIDLPRLLTATGWLTNQEKMGGTSWARSLGTLTFVARNAQSSYIELMYNKVEKNIEK